MKRTIGAAILLAVISPSSFAELGLNDSKKAPKLAQPVRYSDVEMDYKRQVGKRILQANQTAQSGGDYRGVTVVAYTIDNLGTVSKTWIVRSCGDASLDERAMSHFKRAMPLPLPPGNIFVIGEQYAQLAEAFVHTSDGYRLQSLLK